MKRINFLAVAMVLLLAGNVRAEVTLFSTDFSSDEWTDHATICSGETSTETVNGITFVCRNNNKQYSISNGVLTWADNNLEYSYYIAIPLKNINGKLDITIGTAQDELSIAYTIVEADLTSVPSYSGSCEITGYGYNKNGKIHLKHLMSGTGSTAWLLMGRASSYYPSVVKSIEVATPSDSDASLESISINGKAIADFDPNTLNYAVELPYGTKTYPTVTAVCTNPKATYSVGAIIQPDPYKTFPAVQRILCRAQDGQNTLLYELTYTVAENASTDATLKKITLKGLTIDNPKTDTIYTLTYEYLTEMPTVADCQIEFNDTTASLYGTDMPTEWGKVFYLATIAQDNHTRAVYQMKLQVNGAPKLLYEVLFSNGAKGAISDADTIITVPYLSGEGVPTTTAANIKTDSVMIAGAYHKCTAAVDSIGRVVVTGEDQQSIKFLVKGYELSAPASLGTDTIQFDGTEISYIYGAYGYDKTGLGWKFAINVNDSANRRISRGMTRLYMAIPAADSLTLISGKSGYKDIKLYVNGIENTEVTRTAAAGESIRFKVNATKTNLVCIESNEKGGDGGFTGLVLTPAKATPSAIEDASGVVRAKKVLRNGQILILRGDKIYNVQGVQLTVNN